MRVLDPFYWYLKFVHRGFLVEGAEEHEREFVKDNITKHRKVQWITVVNAVLIFLSLQGAKQEEVNVLIGALLAPVMVLGCAWFAISFASIPEKFLDVAMMITFWMYSGFKVSLTAMLLAIGFISPPTLWPVLAFVYISVELACVLYDTADALKIGLHESQHKASRAAILWHRRDHNIDLDNPE